MSNPVKILLVALASVATIAATVAVVRVARTERTAPASCPDGLVAMGPRCCGSGQHESGGRCRGTPGHCARGMKSELSGCVARAIHVSIAGAELALEPSDWQGPSARRAGKVAGFAIDSIEVSVDGWRRCTIDGECPSLDAADLEELGQPVRGIRPEIAERYCQYARGRLPTSDEWLLAAAGSEGRRFPWGATGLACRRAAFGLESGPCAVGARGPDLAGARSDGATPGGVHDLSGNVAEWAREPDGTYVARGGSWLSRAARELETWSEERPLPDARHVGFRCAYPAATEVPP